MPRFLLLERHKSWHAVLSAILPIWPCLMFAKIVRRDSPPDPLRQKHFCNKLSVPLRPAPRQFGCLRPPRRGLNQSFVLLLSSRHLQASRLKCLISSTCLNFHPAQAFFPCLIFSLSSSAFNATLTLNVCLELRAFRRNDVVKHFPNLPVPSIPPQCTHLPYV